MTGASTSHVGYGGFVTMGGDSGTGTAISIETDFFDTTTMAATDTTVTQTIGDLTLAMRIRGGDATLMTARLTKAYSDYSKTCFKKTALWGSWGNNGTANIKTVCAKYKAGKGWYEFHWPAYEYEYECGETGSVVVPVPASQKLQELIQQRQAPQIVVPQGKRPLGHTEDIKEMCARETLKRILGDEGYQSFLSRGFISILAKSGRVYQILPGHGITNVYEMGRMVERLCVVLRGNFPPTDSVIMRYMMILHDEETFRKYAIKHSVYDVPRRIIRDVDQRPLTEIFKALKAAA